MIKKLNIGTRLGLSFSLIILIYILLISIIMSKINILSNLGILMYKHPLTVSNAILRIDSNIIRIQRSIKEIELSKSISEINRQSNLIDLYEDKIFIDFELISQRFLGDKEMYFHALSAYKEWQPIRNDVLYLIKNRNIESAEELAKEKGEDAVNHLNTSISALNFFAQNKANEFLEKTLETKTKTLYLVFSLSLFAIIFLILFLIYLSKTITKPLYILKKATEDIGAGNFNNKINSELSGEFGVLAISFNLMMDKLEESKLILEDQVLNRTLKLKESEEKYKYLVKNAKTSIFKFDKNGFITFINEYACELFEYTEDELLGKHVLNTIVPLFDSKHKDLHKMVSTFFSSLGEHYNKVNENENITKSGKRLWMSWQNQPILDEYGNFNGLISVGTNITKRKIVEDALKIEKLNAEKANLSKSQFLANMSHELRTPLNGILGFSQILQLMENDIEKLDMITMILSAGEHLLNLISSILDLSKIEAGEMEIDNSDFSTHKLIDKIDNLFRQSILKKGLSFNITIDKKLPKFLIGDEFRLEQILINLIGNSLKFTNSGKISLIVNYYDKSIEFIVEDTGIGISEKNKNKIFEKFVQGEHFITKQYGGSGLGLAIVNELVNMMFGTISFESVLGKGSIFTIKIPLKTSQNILEENSSPIDANIFIKSNKNILLAEDDKLSSFLIQEIFRLNSTIKLDHVSNGYEVLKNLDEKKYDLILMDIQMPKLDGLKTCELIRSSHEEYKDIPIIAVTSYAIVGDREKFLEKGMSDYISKPIQIESFLKTVSKYL